jgi:hypothetical protein
VNNLAAAVTHADSHNVDTVFVAGQPVKAAGKILSHDLRSVQRLARESRDRLLRGWAGPGYAERLFPAAAR